jgi:hypothetical protein
MRRLRNPLAAMAIAAVLAVFRLTAGTEPAGAFVTAADQCGAYIYGYQYWGSEYVIESMSGPVRRRCTRRSRGTGSSTSAT